MDKHFSRIYEWVDAHKEEIFQDILDCVAIYSPSEDREKVAEVIDWFKKKAESMGFITELRANGEVISARTKDAEHSIGLISHCDVVPVGDIRMWTRNPYGERKDGTIWGRGVLDDKGMTVLSLWCMKGIQEIMGDTPWGMEAIIGSREEINWDDIDKYYEEGWKLPEYSFTPDGSFPLYNRENGYCDVVFTFPKKGSDEKEISFIKGAAAANSLPGLAEAKVGDIDIVAHGKEVHSSIPEEGDNALVKLLLLLDEMGINKNGYADLYRFVKERLAKSHDGAFSLFLDEHPKEVNGEDMGYTTAVPSVCYLDGDTINININLRLVYGTTHEELERGFQKVCEEYGCTYRIDVIQDPLYVSKDSPLNQAMGEAYTRITGNKVEFLRTGGTSYAKAFPNCVSFGPLFPEDEDLCHVPDEGLTEERIIISEILFMAAVQLFMENAK